jgi:hypothetical protein
MDLRVLPPEILSRVCRFIGLRETKLWQEVYCNEDFMSLRLVCKEIYVNTTYDAGIRYGGDLRCLNIDLRYNSLVWLLHMCSIPAFRDKIEVIHLRHPSFRNSVDDDGPIFLRCSEYEDHLCNEDNKFLRGL